MLGGGSRPWLVPGLVGKGGIKIQIQFETPSLGCSWRSSLTLVLLGLVVRGHMVCIRQLNHPPQRHRRQPPLSQSTVSRAMGRARCNDSNGNPPSTSGGPVRAWSACAANGCPGHSTRTCTPASTSLHAGPCNVQPAVVPERTALPRPGVEQQRLPAGTTPARLRLARPPAAAVAPGLLVPPPARSRLGLPATQVAAIR